MVPMPQISAPRPQFGRFMLVIAAVCSYFLPFGFYGFLRPLGLQSPTDLFPFHSLAGYMFKAAARDEFGAPLPELPVEEEVLLRIPAYPPRVLNENGPDLHEEFRAGVFQQAEPGLASRAAAVSLVADGPTSFGHEQALVVLAIVIDLFLLTWSLFVPPSVRSAGIAATLVLLFPILPEAVCFFPHMHMWCGNSLQLVFSSMWLIQAYVAFIFGVHLLRRSSKFSNSWALPALVLPLFPFILMLGLFFSWFAPITGPAIFIAVVPGTIVLVARDIGRILRKKIVTKDP